VLLLEYVPLLHPVHVAAAKPAYVPAGQLEQPSAAMAVELVPSGHGEQVLLAAAVV